MGTPSWSVNEIKNRAAKVNLIFLGDKNLGSQVKHKFWCEIHKIIVWKSLDSIGSGHGCRECGYEECARKRRRSIEDINKEFKKYNLKCLSRIIKYGKDHLFKWKCLRCGSVFERTIESTKQSKCSNCKPKNLGECFTRICLEALFDCKLPMARPLWLKYGKSKGTPSLDGYNEELKISFEHQGDQHNKHSSLFHSSGMTLRKQKQRDKIKAKLCKDNGVKLITIEKDIAYSEDFKKLYTHNTTEAPIPAAIIEACIKAEVPLPDNYLERTVDLRNLVRQDDAEILRDLQKFADKKNIKILPVNFPFNTLTPLPVECNKCKKRWGSAPNKIKSGDAGCSRCAGMEKIDKSEYHRRAKKMNFTIITKTIKNSQQKVEVKCNKCNTKHFTYPYYLNPNCSKPFLCRTCFPKSSTLKKQKIKDFFKKHNRWPNKRIKKESKLYIYLSLYCREKSGAFDPIFNKWARSLGFGEGNNRKVIHIETKNKYNSITEAGRHLSIPRERIYSVLGGKIKNIPGYTFKYV